MLGLLMVVEADVVVSLDDDSDELELELESLLLLLLLLLLVVVEELSELEASISNGNEYWKVDVSESRLILIP